MYHDNLTLIGMPGAGKSTLGVVLAKKLGMQFIDTDLVIQKNEDALLCELLERHGVEAFIKLEDSILSQIECRNSVVATGGSAIYGENAMRHLSEISHIIYLRADCAQLKTRISPDLLERGVVCRGGNTIEALYAERAPLYERWAEIIVDTEQLSIVQALNKLLKLL